MAAVNARHRGFNALGDAHMYEARKPDHKEFFSIGLELPEDDPDVLAGEKLRGPNNWPQGMPAFRVALEAYYAAMLACGADLMRAVAVSLDLAADFFVASYRKPLQRTQIVYYPPQPVELGEDQFGVAPHSDFGCITLLWQDANGGLEVLERSTRRWIPAPPIEGTLVINVADLLARWTNDRYASTPHRVINRSGRERLSIATFHDPDYQAVVDPRDLGTPDGGVPVCADPGGRAYRRADRAVVRVPQAAGGGGVVGGAHKLTRPCAGCGQIVGVLISSCKCLGWRRLSPPLEGGGGGRGWCRAHT